MPGVDEEPVALVGQLGEVGPAEGHVVRPPEHHGQVVDEQRRDGAGEVLRQLAAEADEDLLGADLAAPALGQLAGGVDVGVEVGRAVRVGWARG